MRNIQDPVNATTMPLRVSLLTRLHSNAHMCKRTYTAMRTCTYTANRTCTYTVMRTCTYTVMRTCTYTAMRTCTYTVMRTCTYTAMRTCVSVLIQCVQRAQDISRDFCNCTVICGVRTRSCQSCKHFFWCCG
jgi:carbohydrate-binding DOMON domain-containing protein